MKEFINIFKKNKIDILNTLLDKLDSNHVNSIKNENLDEVFLYFSSLDTIYAVDENFIQLSPIFNRDRKETASSKGKLKKTLQENIDIENKEYYISSPYMSAKTGKYTITLVKKIDDRFIALDFNLFKLLNEYNHIDTISKIFANASKVVYGIIGMSLTIFALILVFYAIYDFLNNLFLVSNNLFESIFKSTIALTLGLAIFDLAKNLLEHEVVFKEHNHEAHGGNKLLIKFLISIIIALSIEALMMVFKIVIYDYKDILYAVYLLIAIGFLLITMSQYNRYLEKNK